MFPIRETSATLFKAELLYVAYSRTSTLDQLAIVVDPPRQPHHAALVGVDTLDRILAERGEWVDSMCRWSRRTDVFRKSLLALPDTALRADLVHAAQPAAPHYFNPEPYMGQIVVYALISLRDRSVVTIGSTYEWPIRWRAHESMTTQNNSSAGSLTPFGQYAYISGFDVPSAARDLEDELWLKCGQPAASRRLWDTLAAEVVEASNGRLSIHYAFATRRARG